MVARKAKPRVGQRGAAEVRSAGADQVSAYHPPTPQRNEHSDPTLTVSDGQETLGLVFEAGEMFDAVTPGGDVIGQYETKIAAVAAIKASRPHAQRIGGLIGGLPAAQPRLAAQLAPRQTPRRFHARHR